MAYPQMIEQQQEELEIFKNVFSVASGVWRIKDIFVNMYIVSTDRGWVLVDAGLKTSYPKIKKLAAMLFGADSKPDAIVLTHAHFNHVGSLKALAEEWDVSVIAHPLEIPYLTGLSKYPPADPTVGGGMMVYMSWSFPRTSANVGGRAVPLAQDGTISVMPGWRWIATPGHSPGHVSLYREEDACLIAGDAFVTTDQRKASAVASQRREMHGPPPYFTPELEKLGSFGESACRAKAVHSRHRSWKNFLRNARPAGVEQALPSIQCAGCSEAWPLCA